MADPQENPAQKYCSFYKDQFSIEEEQHDLVVSGF